MVYMVTLPGGWIADRLIGQQRAVLDGGMLIASGHFSMAVPSLTTFYLGLVLIVIGTGLLKGNVSVIVGRLYGPDDGRRDAGYSIFYMGINTGAFVAPLVCGYLGQRVSWHVGFAAAGVGMVLGLIQYVLGTKVSGQRRASPRRSRIRQGPRRAETERGALARFRRRRAACSSGSVSTRVCSRSRRHRLPTPQGTFCSSLSIGFFGWLFLAGDWTRVERNHLIRHRRVLRRVRAFLRRSSNRQDRR